MFGLIIIFESRCILGELHLQRLSVTAATQTKQDIKPKKKKNHITKATVKFIAQDIRIIFLIFMNSSCVGIVNSYSLIAVCKWQAGH